MGLNITYTMRKSFINVKAPIQLKSAFSVSDAGWLTQDRKIRGDFCALARKGGKHVIFILENAMTIYFFVGIVGPGKLSCQWLGDEAKFAALGWAAEKVGIAKSMAATQTCHKMLQGTHGGLRMRHTQALLINFLQSLPRCHLCHWMFSSLPPHHPHTHVHSNGLGLPSETF